MIVPMVMVPLVNRIGSRSDLSVKGAVTKDTMLNFDGDFHGHGRVYLMCKRTFTNFIFSLQTVFMYSTKYQLKF